MRQNFNKNTVKNNQSTELFLICTWYGEIAELSGTSHDNVLKTFRDI